MQTVHFKVYGLHCSQEAAVLKKVLCKQKGIAKIDFEVIHGSMTVVYDEALIDSQKIISLVKSTGMRAEIHEERQKKEALLKREGKLIATLLSALFLLAGFIAHWAYHKSFLDILGAFGEDHILPPWTIALYVLAILSGMVYVFPKALIAARHLKPDMNLLMIIAVIGAAAIGEWLEAASVTFLFAVANLLEHWSVRRAKRAISSLLDLSPALAKVIDPQTGEIKEKKVEQIEVGTTLFVKPGEKIPLDGKILKGSTTINQAPITGESLPVVKNPGDVVYAGTINEEGALEILTTKKAKDTALAHIIKLVQKAQSKRAKSEKWVEKFAHYYTPIMLLFALLIAIIPPLLIGEPWFPWIYRGLVILVIACPCALVISTPVSIVSALTSSARSGILIKGGIFLELMGKIKALAMDKTGTLTYGRPEVQKIIPLSELNETELLEIASSLEQASEHPLAKAILKKAEEMNISVKRAENFKGIKGKGAEGTIKGRRYWIGSHRFLHEKNQETEEMHNIALSLEDEGHSVIVVGDEGKACGMISVADSPREMLKEVLLAIKAEGVETLVMLTGDNAPTAKALAKKNGIDRFYAELLPEDKVAIVEKLLKEWKWVAMVGDGINDAPALAMSTVGIAMGAIGTDAAIETADIALMTDDLSKIPWLLRHSKNTLKIIKQNIVFSLSVKALFLLLALFGLASLWMAIAADTGASLLVVFNGLRLLKRRITGISFSL